MIKEVKFFGIKYTHTTKVVITQYSEAMSTTNENLFTKSVSSETKCNQKVIISIKVIKAGLRKLK